MRRISIFIFFCLALSACVGKYQPQDIPQIVVEGWIDAGGYPVVILTTTVSISEEAKEWESLKDNVIRWAKVSVSDGDQEVVLTGRKNTDYFPPYVYTTARLQGEPGKTYTLKVEYSGRVVTAQTSIPQPIPLQWIKVSPSAQKGKAEIVAGLEDNAETKDYYKFFTKVISEDSSYVSSFMGLINDDILGKDVNEIKVNRGIPMKLGSTESSGLFPDDSQVMIKFCTLDAKSFEYWEDFEDLASLSTNPFFPVTRKIRSNVNGGLGYWAGYGSSIYRVSIADSLKIK